MVVQWVEMRDLEAVWSPGKGKQGILVSFSTFTVYCLFNSGYH